MDGLIDIVEGHPQDEVEEQHGASNHSCQEVDLLVVAEGAQLIHALGEEDINAISTSLQGVQYIIIDQIAQPDQMRSVLVVLPGHDGDIHAGVAHIVHQPVPSGPHIFRGLSLSGVVAVHEGSGGAVGLDDLGGEVDHIVEFLEKVGD
jgi:NCAIR mutase (PurE)-related protein